MSNKKAVETDIFFYIPDFLTKEEADDLFHTVRKQTPWNQVSYQKPYGLVTTPRLSHCYGFHDWNKEQIVEGIKPQRWPRYLTELKNSINKFVDEDFNFVLLNLYRFGKDSISYHADDETYLGEKPIIASVSLGQPRRFILRKKEDHSVKHVLEPAHGSLLIMFGECQEKWEHAVPKTRKQVGERINLTMRKALTLGGSKNYYRYNVGKESRVFLD